MSVTSYNPTRVKKSLTGSGRAGKLQVQWAIQRELGLAALPEPSDVADAMAIGLTHIHAISLEKPELL
jgi:crossover junction endodeoxyribonuclease RuvC